jgi:hypothetical protein
MLSQRPNARDWLWFIVLGVLSSVWCLTALSRIGATWDEPGYIRKGLAFWHTRSHVTYLNVGTLPLVMDFDTLPIYLRERIQGHPTSYLNGDDPQALQYARVASLFWWWLLLFYAMLTGNLLAGKLGGRAAIALLAFEPVLLANVLLMADIALCACLLAFLYHYRVGRERPWGRRVGIPALWFAIAVLAKLSALFLAPACVGVIELGLIWRSASASGRLSVKDLLREILSKVGPILWDFAQIAGLGFILVILYCGSGWRVASHLVDAAERLKSHAGLRILYPLAAWIAHIPIFPNAISAIAKQLRMNSGDRGTYFLGHAYPGSLWYYFPLALTMKLTLPLLALPIVLAIFRPRTLLNWACGGALILLLMSVFNRTQIGVRLELPVVALGAVGLAAAVADAAKSSSTNWQRRCWTAVPIVVLLSAGYSSLSTWPDALVYFNKAWGRSEQGYLLISDSNYDMGQGLPDLAQWQREHNAANVDVLFFGRDPAILRMPVHQIPLEPTPVSLPPMEPERYLAVSINFVYGVSDDVRNNPEVESLMSLLRTRNPDGQAGTFFIYDEAKITAPR